MSLEVVLPTGASIRTPGVPNHASGPDFMRLFLGSEGTFGIITEATMRITRLPETRLFRAMLFKDVATGLEAGRRMMVDRLDPLVIRMYDPHSTASLVKRVLGYELAGAYMIIGFDGWRRSPARRKQRALAICDELGARDLGREPGERWWNHRYDFYYPPHTLHLPAMYGTVETVATFDRIEAIYHAKKAAIERHVRAIWASSYIGHFSHWFPWGASLYDRFLLQRRAGGSARGGGAARPDLGRRRDDVARARRDDQRASRRRPQAQPLHAGAVRIGAGRCSRRSSTRSIRTAS